MLTSPAIAWNACGAFMATTLGGPTVAYKLFAFFNWMNPIISAIYGITGITIVPLPKDKDARVMAEVAV